jgi:hypothetical protein
MTNSQRLANLERHLQLLYEKLGVLERQTIIDADPSRKFQLNNEIQEAILEICKYEQEYWEIYPLELFIIPEDTAEEELRKFQKAFTSWNNMLDSVCPPQLSHLLGEINARLDNPEQRASARLKLVLPLIPMLASYELETDRSGVVYITWRSIRSFLVKLLDSPDSLRSQENSKGISSQTRLDISRSTNYSNRSLSLLKGKFYDLLIRIDEQDRPVSITTEDIEEWLECIEVIEKQIQEIKQNINKKWE